MTQEQINDIFKALPHVTEIWVDKSNNFHLHSNNGGERFVRGEAKKENVKLEPKKPTHNK